MRLVLWDIDGTLVDTAGHGAGAFADAFEVMFGRLPEGRVPMAGRTDHEIALSILERNRIDDGEAHLPGMWQHLEAALVRKRDAIRADGRAMPGATAALQALHDRPDVLQSLLTGNIEANAATKLGAFGLERWIDLEIGGYGSDGGVRSELVAVALGRAEAKHGVKLGPRDAVLVGDTPLDVAAGRAAGARVVAVASGHSSEEELRGAGPDAVLNDLRDTDALLEAILS
ncbi:MAG: haloacid dehalogenase-like hydrolase [Actinomycetota bacterium]|nr:haloacid dehalogenase-like hydrolase [Actinomycetota bacterium]MDQ3720317.1 haloacid dehalogenase-like hydrolase [Actinomycetota bacterium]